MNNRWKTLNFFFETFISMGYSEKVVDQNFSSSIFKNIKDLCYKNSFYFFIFINFSFFSSVETIFTYLSRYNKTLFLSMAVWPLRNRRTSLIS